MSFNSASFAKRLLSLDHTSASITGLSNYIQLQITNILPLAETWMNEFPKMSEGIQLAMVYVLDNVFQTVARKGNHHPYSSSQAHQGKPLIDIYMEAFKVPLLRAIAIVCSNSSASVLRSKLERILTIWKDRQVITLETAKEFEKAVTDPEEVLFRNDAENPEALVLAASNRTGSYQDNDSMRNSGSKRRTSGSSADPTSISLSSTAEDENERSSSPLTVLEKEILGTRINDPITTLQPTHDQMMYEETYLQMLQSLRTMEKIELATAFSTEEFTNSGIRGMIERAFIVEDRLKDTTDPNLDRNQLLSSSLPLVPSTMVTILTKHHENLTNEKRTREQMNGYISKFLKLEETESEQDSKAVEEAKNRLRVLRILRKELKHKKQKLQEDTTGTKNINTGSSIVIPATTTLEGRSTSTTSPVTPNEAEEGEVTVASILAFATGTSNKVTTTNTINPPAFIHDTQRNSNNSSKPSPLPSVTSNSSNPSPSQTTVSTYPSSTFPSNTYNPSPYTSSFSSSSSSSIGGTTYPTPSSSYPSYTQPPMTQYTPSYPSGPHSVPSSSSRVPPSTASYAPPTSVSVVHPHLSSSTFKDTTTSDDFGAIYNAGAARTEYYRAMDKQVSGGFGYGYDTSIGGPPPSTFTAYPSAQSTQYPPSYYPSSGSSTGGVGLNLPPPNVRYPSSSSVGTYPHNQQTPPSYYNQPPSSSSYPPSSSRYDSHQSRGTNRR